MTFLKKYFKKKNFPLMVIAGGTALVVVFGLLYGNFKLIDFFSYVFEKNQYKDATVLFYGDNCSQCTRVEDFIKNNGVEKKVTLVRLEVFNNELNANILNDKAQVCHLGEDHIGVPFLWEGPQRRCVVGYVDIINFLKEKLKSR